MGAVAERLTYAQYLALAESSEEMFEFHDGAVKPVAGSSAAHARIVGQLARLLDRSESSSTTIPLGTRVRVEASNRTLLPDVIVVCGPLEHSKEDGGALANPAVICEVYAANTEDYDQGFKFKQYRRIPSLREYVVIAQERRSAWVSRRVGDLWAFEDIEADGVLRLEALELELPLADIYTDAFGIITP